MRLPAELGPTKTKFLPADNEGRFLPQKYTWSRARKLDFVLRLSLLGGQRPLTEPRT